MLKTYCLKMSFDVGQLGRQKQRLCDSDGRLQNDFELWEAGNVAYQHLKHYFPSGMSNFDFENWFNQVHGFLCDDFYPIILERIANGRTDLRPLCKGKDDFIEAWDAYDFPERAEVFLSFIDQQSTPWLTDEKLKAWAYSVSAMALLWRLDDAVIAMSLDGGYSAYLITHITELKHRLQPPDYHLRAYELAGNKSSIALAKKGADITHIENRAAKAQVFEWLDKNFNKSKSMDDFALDLAGKLVPYKFRTVRDWLTEWNRLRSASKP